MQSLSTLPNPTQRDSTVHLASLDSLRAIAAIYIAVHHAFQLSGIENKPLPQAIQALVKFFSYGHYSVDLFIVLSGFCLMIPIVRNHGKLRGTFKQFCFKRARRILPPYYFAMLLSLTLIGTCIGQPTGGAWDISIPVTLKDVVTHILLVHDLFRDTTPKINSAFWSIAVEWRIYFLFPVLVIAWKRWGGMRTTLLATGFSYLIFLIASKISFLNLDPIGACPHYLGLFAMGMLGADIVFNHSDINTFLRKEISWNLLSIFFMLLALPAYNLFMAGGQSWVIADLMVGVACMSFLIATTNSPSHPFSSALEWKPLAKVGSFSYSLYLIHVPLLQVIIQYLFKPLNLNSTLGFVVLIASIPLVILVSYLFFLLFEKPFLTKRVKQDVKIP